MSSFSQVRLLASENLRWLVSSRTPFERGLHASSWPAAVDSCILIRPAAVSTVPAASALPHSRFIACRQFPVSQARFFFSNKSETAAETQQQQQQGARTEEPQEAAAAATAADIQKLSEKITQLEEKNAELLDKYKRSLADFENLRNRMNKQVADAKVFGIQGFCKDLLEVADVLQKAATLIPEEVLKSESTYLKDMHQGLTLTQTQLLKVFERHGLVQENPLGQKFDPNKHDAIFQIPAPDKDPLTVLDVQKIGYILNGRTIRAAAVGVSRK